MGKTKGIKRAMISMFNENGVRRVMFQAGFVAKCSPKWTFLGKFSHLDIPEPKSSFGV